MSKQFRPMASIALNPVINSAAWLKEVIFFSGSTVKTPSLMLSRIAQHGLVKVALISHERKGL
jgi:hypothetical protein